MSRHRDVRCMNYSDEYDNYDDVYGHSVEDDYCVSPSAQQFMFDRSKQPNISSFFTEPDIVEDNEDVESISADSKLPKLSELDTAKLISCTEAIKNVIGDKYPDSELHKKIIEFDFNTETALNSILNTETIKIKKDGQLGEMDTQTQSDLKSKDSFIDSQLIKKLNTTSSSLSNLSSQNSKSLESNSFNSLADLATHNLKMSDKKLNSTNFATPKMNFNSSKLSHFNTNSSINDDSMEFNDLANLAAHHLKISNEKMSKAFQKKSPFNSNTSNFNSKSISHEISQPSFESLADLSAHHLNVLSENADITKSKDSSTQFIIPKITTNTKKLDKYNMSSLSSTSHDDDFSKHETNSFFPYKFHTEKHSINCNQERFSNDISQNISKLILEDISNLNYEDMSVPDQMEDTEIDSNLYEKLYVKKEKSRKLLLKQVSSDSQSDISLSTIKAIKEKCKFNAESTDTSVKLLQKTVSAFGKVLCKRYRRKTPYKRKDVALNPEEDSKLLLRFNFSLPSPDDKILETLKYKLVVRKANASKDS